MLYLNSLLGSGNIQSGEIQIDIPIPEKWKSKWKPQGSDSASQATAGLTLAGGVVGGIFGGALGAGAGALGGYITGTVSGWMSQGQVGGRYSIPVGYGYKALRAFCTEDITITLGNEWDSILPNINTLTKISQYWNEGNIVTWLSSTKASWKASKPLTFPLTFYVFSFSRDQESALKLIEPLVEFAGIDQGNGRWDAFNLSGNSIRVHGGYRVDAFESNEQYIQKSIFTKDDNSTFKIHFGNKICIDNLLLGNIQVTHSNVYVESGVPLYVKVQANFRTVGVPTIYDIRRWYGV